MRNTLLVLILSTLAGQAFAAGQSKDTFSIGMGAGIPYGGFGFGIAAKANDHLDLTAGMGMLYDIGFAVGARFLPFPKESSFRISPIYGTNATIISERKESFHGWNLGLGFGARANETGFSFDGIFIFQSDEYKDKRARITEEGRLQKARDRSLLGLSAGYQWSF